MPLLSKGKHDQGGKASANISPLPKMKQVTSGLFGGSRAGKAGADEDKGAFAPWKGWMHHHPSTDGAKVNKLWNKKSEISAKMPPLSNKRHDQGWMHHRPSTDGIKVNKL